MTDRLAYSVTEVAQQLGVPEKTVRGWVRDGVLACYRIHQTGKRGRVLVPAAAVERLLEESLSRGRAG